MTATSRRRLVITEVTSLMPIRTVPVGGEQAGYATEQGRLAGAARPKYGDKFMPGGGEVDVLDRRPPVKRFAEPAHGKLHLARRTRQVGILARSRHGYAGLTAHSSYEPFAQPS